MISRMTSNWRIELAERIAPIYTAIPDVAAVVVIGGVVRGRGDAYSDLDIAIFWGRAPQEDERRAAADQISVQFDGKITPRSFKAAPAIDKSETGLLWEDMLYLGGDSRIGFKIDINHRTISAMERIFNDVIYDHDTHGHKLEVMYALQHVQVLYGIEIIRAWQTRCREYPDKLAQKLLNQHLDQLNFDVEMHVYRGDLHLYYMALVNAQHHLIRALMALNRVYPPEFKRLDSLFEELAIKPPDLASRINDMLRLPPQDGIAAFDTLVNEASDLIAANMPAIDIDSFMTRFTTRRQPFDESPLD